MRRTIALQGWLNVQSQYANPISGRGQLIVSDTGVEWQIRRFLGGRRDAAAWYEMYTFGREGSVLHITWLSISSPGFGDPFLNPTPAQLEEAFESALMTAVRFKGQQSGCLQAMAVARAHLSSSGWKSDWVSPEGVHLGEVWARDWVPSESDARVRKIEKEARAQAEKTLAALADTGITYDQLLQVQWEYLDVTRSGMGTDVSGPAFIAWARERLQRSPLYDDGGAAMRRVQQRWFGR